MTRRLLLISLTLLLLAKQYVVAEEDFCVWCNKEMANNFMNCITEKLMNEPQFGNIPKNSINDVKSSMLAASNAMTSTSQSSEAKMLNGALAGEISGLVKSQMVLTGQSAHEVTAKIMDMIANCYIGVTGKPHAHFVRNLGKAVDFMLSEDQDDNDSPSAVASSSAQSGNNAPVQRPPPVLPQAPYQQVPIRNPGFVPFNQRSPLNSQPPPNSKPMPTTNEQPNREFPINNESPREFNHQVPVNNQHQPTFHQQPPLNNQPPPTFNRPIPFNGQPAPGFNRPIPFNGQPAPGFNRPIPFNQPSFIQRPQYFNQPHPNADHQLPTNNQPSPILNQGPQFPPGRNQIAQENRPPFQVNNLPQENNFKPIPNNFPRQWNIPANNPERPTDSSVARPIQGQSQPQTFQENKQTEPNNLYRNFPRTEPNQNRNLPSIYQQNPSNSASSAVAVNNVPSGGNFNAPPNVPYLGMNPKGPQIQTPVLGNRPEVTRIENLNQNRYQPGQFVNRFPLNVANRPNAVNYQPNQVAINNAPIVNPPNNQPNSAATAVATAVNPLNNQPNPAGTAANPSNNQPNPTTSAVNPPNNQPNQAGTAVASADNPSNNQPNQAADNPSNNQPNQVANASSAAASETETSNDDSSNQEQDGEQIDNAPNAEASDSASAFRHRKHKHKPPQVDNVDSREACALRFGETLFVYLTNSTIFPKVLDTSTPKSFASMIIPEVNKRAATDSGYEISADQIEALSKIYMMRLPEGTNSQLYGEKMSKAVMVPLFQTGFIGDDCEAEAKSIGSNILKYLKLVIPYLNNIKRKASQSSSSPANSQNGNAVAVASASSSSDANADSDNQQYDDEYYTYDDGYTDYNSNDYNTKQDVDTTPGNNKNEYLTTTADVDENCDYDEHWQETSNTNQEPEENNNNNQISSSATAEADSNSQTPFKSFGNLFQRPQTPTQDQPDSSSSNAGANTDSQAPSRSFWAFSQKPNENPVQSSSSSTNAEANSDSQAPNQKYWSYFQRPNENPIQSSGSSANAETNSNSQAPRQKFWSFFQKPNKNSVQPSVSSTNAEADSNSQAPNQKYLSYFPRPNENPTQSSSSANAETNSNSQAARPRVWPFFQKPSENPAQSSSSSTDAGDNSKSPFGGFWSIFRRPKAEQASWKEPGFAPIAAPSDNSNGNPSSASNQVPDSVQLQDSSLNQNKREDQVLNEGSDSMQPQPSQAVNQGPIPNQNSGPRQWKPYQGFANTPNGGPANTGPGFIPNQGPANTGPEFIPNQEPANTGPGFIPNQGPGGGPNQYPKPIGGRFGSIPDQVVPFSNQGFGPWHNRDSLPVQASEQASNQEPSNAGPEYAPNQEIDNSPNFAPEEAMTDGPMEESGEGPQDGPGETDYWGSGMEPNTDEEQKKMSSSSPVQESGGAPDEGPGKTDKDTFPNLGPGANQGSETNPIQNFNAEPNHSPDQSAQNPHTGLANYLANSPDANTKSQMEELKAACIRSITKNGYNYNELISTMGKISKDMKNIHSDWSVPKIFSFTNFATMVACTQVLQNVATAMATQNARPREIPNSNSANAATTNFEAPVNRGNEATIKRENETPTNIIIERNNNFNERPAILPPNNAQFISKSVSRPYVSPQQGQNNRNFQRDYNNAPNYSRQPAFGQQNSFPIAQRQSFSSASASASASENNEFSGGGREYPAQQAIQV
nr:uncharacterized protein LOC107436513 isoform X2 [Parasteatoda tepidariorum]